MNSGYIISLAEGLFIKVSTIARSFAKSEFGLKPGPCVESTIPNMSDEPSEEKVPSMGISNSSNVEAYIGFWR